MILDALITRLRSGEMTLPEFATAAAAEYIFTNGGPDYPETDGSRAAYGVSAATLSNAVDAGELTEEEADAVYDAADAACR